MALSDPVQQLLLLDPLAEWSEWFPFQETRLAAPRVPGVYVARRGESGPVVYVGMAGERASGGTPKGLQGRLARYASGKAIASGLGEAVFDRALSDVEWVRGRLAALEAGANSRATDWGKAAFEWAALFVRWSVSDSKAAALSLELDASGL